MAVSEQDFKSAMRYFPAAVSIVTCFYNGQLRGLTATAVCSLCAEPVPSVLVCVNRSGTTYPNLKRAGTFAINVLNAGQQEIARLFASPDPKSRAERFHTGNWEMLPSGAPILADAVTIFDCRLSQEIEHGTHSILVGTVMDVRINGGEANLLYTRGRFTQLQESETA